MMEFIRAHQLNIELSLSSICGIIALFAFLTRTMPKNRRKAMIGMQLGAMLLLLFDRFAYIYRGDPGMTGYIMVRVSNYMTFTLSIALFLFYNQYVKDLLITEGELPAAPKRLMVADLLGLIALLLIVISQFTGLYYTFDETNHYQRSSGFILCYLMPVVISALQISTILRYRKRLSRKIWTAMALFAVIPIAASVLQIFTYGLSLTNMSVVLVAVLLFIFVYLDMNDAVEKANERQAELYRKEEESMHQLFEQTATAFVNAIDAKDANTQGHSLRVAAYARRIAEEDGKSEEECEKIYYAALLHDVGKIGLPDSILKKEEELTKEEVEIARKQPTIGAQILSGISEFPYLSVGARYHRERFDGKGYPEMLKGDAIPEIARIIAVADAYDTMTTRTGYRDALPQQVVREELVKGSGSQFDPRFAGIMLQLMGSDRDYLLLTQDNTGEAISQSEFLCGEYRTTISNGIEVTNSVTRITFRCEKERDISAPALILFDAFDARVHSTARAIRDTGYVEYGELWFDGHFVCTSARNMKMKPLSDGKPALPENRYEIEAVKYRDHTRIRLYGHAGQTETIMAVSDSSRSVFIALTGEHCHITDVEIVRSEETVGEDGIERIAEEVSYINRLSSDIPNVQIDGYREKYTEGIEIRDGLRLVFHSMSFPASNLVWHCPFILLYSADDGQVNGEGYREYALIRFDGETHDSKIYALNEMTAEKNEQFKSWEDWKSLNKAGMECEVVFRRKRNRIITTTENGGISIQNITTLKNSGNRIYAAVTGDLCAITDIRVYEK